MFLNWSDEPVEGALAFVKPGKKVPGFKFKQHGGKSELVREMVRFSRSSRFDFAPR